MEEYPLVSVIIPCYNLHSYILQCLESVAAQDYPNYEVIVVDDGSRDDSREIIDAFLRDNPRFSLISKENGGLSSARNAGIRAAAGRWITFIDGDDWVGPGYISGMMDGLRRYPAQLCTAGAQSIHMRTGETKTVRKTTAEYGVLRENLDHYHSWVYVWARMYSLDIIREHELCFDEQVRYGEDRPFNFSYLQYVREYLFVEDRSYRYRVLREGSLGTGIVYPKQKGYTFGYPKQFLNTVGDIRQVEALLSKNQKLTGHAADMLLSDLLNAALDGDRCRYLQLASDEVSRALLRHFSPTSGKSRALAALAKGRAYFLTRICARIYYQDAAYRWRKKVAGRN